MEVEHILMDQFEHCMYCYMCFQLCLFVCLFVCLSFCLSVSNTSQNVMNRLWWKFKEGSAVAKGTSDYILVAIRITMLTAQSKMAITQQIMNRFWWKFQVSSATMKKNNWLNFRVIWITMLTLQIGNPCNIGVMSCLGQGGHCPQNALILCVNKL